MSSPIEPSFRVENYLPHRYPFLLVDRVLEAEPGVSIKAIKLVSSVDPYLQGHFPGNPIMPGVLIIEALAQAAGILARLSFPERNSSCLLTEIENARFRRQVTPGDCLELTVKAQKTRKDFFWFEAFATVNGDLAASAHITAKMS
jgi:3-hydroxyacyl-[acyl-carrier-protein] dehydratase